MASESVKNVLSGGTGPLTLATVKVINNPDDQKAWDELWQEVGSTVVETGQQVAMFGLAPAAVPEAGLTTPEAGALEGEGSALTTEVEQTAGSTLPPSAVEPPAPEAAPGELP